MFGWSAVRLFVLKQRLYLYQNLHECSDASRKMHEQRTAWSGARNLPSNGSNVPSGQYKDLIYYKNGEDFLFIYHRGRVLKRESHTDGLKDYLCKDFY